MSKKILVISHDKVGRNMAGPGIRYHKIATELSKNHEVTLGVFNPVYIEDLEPKTISYKAIDIHVQKYQKEFAKHDVIIALWLSDEMIEFAKSKNIILVFDLYAPVPVEDLMQRVYGKKTDKESDYDYSQMLSNYRHFVNNGDFLLTSNLQQQDFWMGYAFSGNKILPSTQNSRSIETYFGISPMGIDLAELEQLNDRHDLLSKRLESIKKDDFVIVWTGGIWDWFDAKTPISSIDHLNNQGINNVKLVFLGTKHPNDDVPAMEETEIARKHASKLGLLNKSVFFLDGWLPYGERIHYLKRANLALYAHKPSIEARFSHRTRVLDHILMSLPTVATAGDYFSDYIQTYGLGKSVNPLDTKAMSAAIKDFAIDKKLYSKTVKNIKKQQSHFTWDYTLSPLKDFLSNTYSPSSYAPRTSASKIESISNKSSLKAIKRLVPKKIKSTVKRILQ